MKKKSLLLAISAMSIAAIGVGTVGTFAWYTASSAATLSQVAQSSTITTAAATAQVGSYYMSAKFASASHELVQTDASGNCWVIVNGVLQPATKGDKDKFASNVITLGFYSNAEATTACTEAQLKDIGAKFDTVTVTVAATGRVRVTDTAVTTTPDNFAAAFDGQLGGNYTFTATISTGGVVASNTSTAYVSVFGQAGDDATLAAGTAAAAQYAEGGTVGTSCAAHERSAG